MTAVQNDRVYETILVLLFIVTFVTLLIFAQNPNVNVLLSSDVFIAWLTLIAGVIISFCGMTATLGILMYSQNKKFRDLMISIVTFDGAFLTLFFVLTYPGMPFETFISLGLEKAQMFAFFAGFIPPAGFSTDLYLSHLFISDRTQEFYRIVGFILVPILIFLVAVLPVPIPALSDGVESLTLLGGIVSGIFLFLVFSSLVGLAKRFIANREFIDLAFIMSLAMLILSSVLSTTKRGLYEGVHLIGILASGFAIFFVMLGITRTFSNEQHDSLSREVEKRSRALQLAKEESEFYLYLFSHEVGNLLQGLAFYIDIIGENERDESLQDAASDLMDNISTILSRITEMAEVKKEEAQGSTRVDVIAALNDSISTIQRALDTEFFLEFDHPNREIFVEGNDLLKQVFINLLKNSIQHSDKDVPAIDVSIEIVGDEVKVKLQDNGPPLPMKVRASLFEKFVPSESGFGLGLFIVKKILTRFDGRIEYVRENEISNVFSVILNLFQ